MGGQCRCVFVCVCDCLSMCVYARESGGENCYVHKGNQYSGNPLDMEMEEDD